MESIEKKLKKLIYTGIGFVSLSAEKFKTTIEDLVKDDKISEKEGEEIIKDFFKEADEKKDKYKSKISKLIKTTTKKMNFAKADELEKLSKRLQELEKAVAEKMKKN